ncbi:hypothetical protein FB451DRAFT_1285232 [Mycena latifolia]|nr:hypothetical protein FB451DRAFT_1285232 [Mycena latifolia]
MTSLKVLLDDSVSAFSGRDARLTLTVRIDIALQELEQAHATTKAANRSPVKQALKLFRSRSTAKLNVQLESRRVRADDNAAVAALAQEVSSGRRALLSLQPPEILLLQRALRTRRNSVAPVFRLPTEVLAPILELCPTIEDDSPQFHTDNFVSGLRLAHVCRRWREVAMGSARFWTHIVLSRPRWALEMLHRSRVAPLVVGVDITASATKTVAARDLVLAQLPRIRELRVQNARFHSIPSALLSSAPILDTFHLCYDPPARVVEVITPALFAGQAPALRHLSLRFCMLHLDSPLWDNLVSLKLAYASAFLPLFLTRMPHFLLRMAHLQALTLIESNPAELADLEDEGPVTLKLNSLVIEGISWYCYCFLRTVLLPACRIWFRVPYSNSDLRFVWNALESQRGRADDPVICGLKFADVRPKLDGPSPATSQFEVSLFGRSDPTEPRYTVLFTIDPPLPNWREEALYTMMAIMYLEQRRVPLPC